MTGEAVQQITALSEEKAIEALNELRAHEFLSEAPRVPNFPSKPLSLLWTIARKPPPMPCWTVDAKDYEFFHLWKTRSFHQVCRQKLIDSEFGTAGKFGTPCHTR